MRAVRLPMTVAAPATSNCSSVTRVGVAAGMTFRPASEGGGADGCVDEEDGLPAGPRRQGSAEQDAGCDAEGSDGSPEREAEAALRSRVGRHDDGQRSRGHQGCGESLSGAGRDELACAAGESADDRRDGEDGQAGQEHPLAGEQVGDAATEQQSAAGHHQVGGDDPLHVGSVQVEVTPDGRQSRVDDGDVEDDEDLGGEGEGQDGPRLARLFAAVAVLVGSGCAVVEGGVGQGVRCATGVTRGGVDRERINGGLRVHDNSLMICGRARLRVDTTGGRVLVADAHRRRNAWGSRRPNGRVRCGTRSGQKG